ncbi:MAG: hypothetical protein JWM89_2374 [Acidimicrobiales bacterium]|nr:hypothetical protein [Acidimicrobiales bacterium]
MTEGRDERTGKVVHVDPVSRRRRPKRRAKGPEHPHHEGVDHRDDRGHHFRAVRDVDLAGTDLQGTPPRLAWSERLTLAPLWWVVTGVGPRWWGVVDDYREVPWAEGADPRRRPPFGSIQRGWRIVDEDWVRVVDAHDERHVAWLRLAEADANRVLEAGIVAVHGGPARTMRRHGVVVGPFGTLRLWIFPRTQKWIRDDVVAS